MIRTFAVVALAALVCTIGEAIAAPSTGPYPPPTYTPSSTIPTYTPKVNTPQPPVTYQPKLERPSPPPTYMPSGPTTFTNRR